MLMETSHRIFDLTNDMDDEINAAWNMISDMQGESGASNIVSNDQTLHDIRKDADENRHGKTNALKTGFSLFDSRFVFRPDTMTVIAAFTSVGKSALAMQWAWNFAEQGLKVGYYNCEMQEAAVLERMISSKSGISTTRIRLAKAFLGDEEERYRKAVAELEKQDRIIMFTGSKKVSDIRSDMREHRFDIVIIDYLQLLWVADRYRGNRVAEVGELSIEIKCLCMDYDIPIIALSQLSRASEGRNTKEPQLSDLRESGSLEQDASIVFFLWDKEEEDKSQKGFKVSKSRNGVCSRHDLIFDGASMTFYSESNVTPFD
jgi:replicative DNA helicase